MAKTEENIQQYSSKMSVIQVLAGLITDPLLFANDRYRFNIQDFPDQFHRIVFGAIEHLAKNGMEKIGFLDIDTFLKSYEVQYKVFSENKGPEYIQRAVAMYNPKKFDYYYQTLKKYSLLRRFNEFGFSTVDILDPSILDPMKNQQMQQRFDDMSINDILGYMESKMLATKEEFGTNSYRVENKASDGLKALVDQLKETPEMGMPLLSPKLTTIVRGMRKGCLFMESAPQSYGKSRRGAGEACHLAVKEYYDANKQEWIHTGLSESVLVINTEMELRECQQMYLAFVSGVSESHIKDGRYAPGEEDRINKAIQLIEESNLYFVSVTNFDAEDIVNLIKKYKQLYNVEYVFFDYLGESSKIISSVSSKTRVQGLRTDQVLLDFSSKLKDTAKTLDIYIWTATQLSGDFKNAKDLDASFLRSAKSLADKPDAAWILMPVREQDQSVISSYCAKGFELTPNFVWSIYKVRAGSWQNIKLYFFFDRSTCQVVDCFVTDSEGHILPIADTDIKVEDVEQILDATKEENFNSAFTGGENTTNDSTDSFEF